MMNSEFFPRPLPVKWSVETLVISLIKYIDNLS